VDKSKSVFSLI